MSEKTNFICKSCLIQYSREVAKSVKKLHTVVNIIPTSIVNGKKALKVKSCREGKEKFPSRHAGLPEILIITQAKRYERPLNRFSGSSSSRDGGSKSGIRDGGSRELAEKCMGKIRMQRLPYVASSHDGGTESFSGELTKG
ncbi:hypothetical protein HZH66_002625 [Vespula vulgaris]|uniref:Uncharacterized protein n=1 Tax=Vespula vulgaris TaxID=7454 RepID=A0A834KJZ1_VESVU|nr:hypothetical protein HZH66_002625 [Vespula vulgaris]